MQAFSRPGPLTKRPPKPRNTPPVLTGRRPCAGPFRLIRIADKLQSFFRIFRAPAKYRIKYSTSATISPQSCIAIRGIPTPLLAQSLPAMDITNMLNNKVTSAQYQQHMAQASYPSPSQLQDPLSMLGTNYSERSFENMYLPQHQNEHHMSSHDANDSQRHSSNGAIKAFACTNCGKGFARRSDLARHGKVIPSAFISVMLINITERIHTGDRPHVCPEKGCGKQFIQRSALTVHMRVHSGEKPHMCERCGKVRGP